MRKMLLLTAVLALGATAHAQEFVDLGLSVKWATYNLGATAPEAYGNYYAWGETEPNKGDYSQENYQWMLKNDDGTLVYDSHYGYKYSKYTLSTLWNYDGVMTYIKGDDKTELDPEDDAVTASLGLPYRMPRLTEIQELLLNCIRSDTLINDVSCVKFTGPNGNYITLPKGGVIDHWDDEDHLISEGDEGYYLTSTLFFNPNDKTNVSSAQHLYVAEMRECYRDSYYRHVGLNIRPVCPVEPEAVDLGLRVMWAPCNLGASMPQDCGYYFAWGETVPKGYFNWEGYKFGNESLQTKYTNDDGVLQLEAEDDAATANWGNRWRMPTLADFEELRDECDLEFTTIEYEGIFTNVLKVTGPNGNFIYLPCAGQLHGGINYDPTDIFGKVEATYWSSESVHSPDGFIFDEFGGTSFNAAFPLGTDEITLEPLQRCYGLPIRPVWDDSFTSVKNIKPVEDTLVNVYNLQGMLLRSGVNRDDATNGLPHGIYIVGGKKVVK